MPCNPRKDMSKCVAKRRAYLNDGGTRNFWDVYFWDSVESLRENSGVLEEFYHEDQQGNTMAACCHMPRWVNEQGAEVIFQTPKSGELHFAVTFWSVEIIAHELLHAFLAWLKYSPRFVRGLIKDQDIDVEEDFCHAFSAVLGEIHRTFWKLAPSDLWVKQEYEGELEALRAQVANLDNARAAE